MEDNPAAETDDLPDDGDPDGDGDDAFYQGGFVTKNKNKTIPIKKRGLAAR